MKYSNYLRNHVIIPGREKALETFLNQEYKGMQHKFKNGFSSNSEDALTWSCFEVLSSLPFESKIFALDEILEDSYQGQCNFRFRDRNYLENEIEIFVGKTYTGQLTTESTEVDASIELPDKLIFFEAKLYSPLSSADETKPHDQIAKKLRVGLDSCGEKEFYFIFLDIAPKEKLNLRKSKKEAKQPAKKYHDKWKSAWWFNYYKKGRNKSLKPLREILEGINVQSLDNVSKNMGWLTWTDLFKTILRGIFKNNEKQ